MKGNNADAAAKRMPVKGENSSGRLKQIIPMIPNRMIPEASPSSPSIILIALVNAITAITVIGIDNTPSCKG